jgi:hypothetical protein
MRSRILALWALAACAFAISWGQGCAQKTVDAPWVSNTSGPFFTGTADAEPAGSYYIEPFLYYNLTPGQGAKQYNMQQRLSTGWKHDYEFDIYAPLIYSEAGPPTTPQGVTASHFGYGNTHLELKKQFVKETDRTHVFRMPSLALTANLYIPTGKYQNLNPKDYGIDQLGNGTWDEEINGLLRKEFRPFEVYMQLADIIQNPTTVHGGYTYNNNITVVPPGQTVHMVDGNLLYYAGALEYVAIPKYGIGGLIEYNGEAQNSHNPIFGTANAPSWSFFHMGPELEFTWPNSPKHPITWGGGYMFPVTRSGYPRTFIPMFTVTFYNNRGGAR